MSAVVALGLLAGAVSIGTAAAEKPVEVRAENPLPIFSAGLAPKELSRTEPMPVRFSISSESRLMEEAPLRGFVLEADRNVSVDVDGLPACGLRRLRSPDTDTVAAACADTIVGTGTGEALLAYPEHSPIPVSSDLLVFNGGVEGRVTTFHIRGVNPLPHPKAIVATVKIERVRKGRYGSIATTRIPVIAEGYGAITAFSLEIEKSYVDQGERHSVLSAICTDGKLLARGEALFEADPGALQTAVEMPVVRPCLPSSAPVGKDGS